MIGSITRTSGGLMRRRSAPTPPTSMGVHGTRTTDQKNREPKIRKYWNGEPYQVLRFGFGTGIFGNS